MFYPLKITVNRATAHLHAKVFGSGQYLEVLGHGLAEDKPRRAALAVFEVLEVAAINGGFYAPRGGGLIYVEFFGEGLVRCALLVTVQNDLLDGADGLADYCWDSSLDTLGDEVGY